MSKQILFSMLVLIALLAGVPLRLTASDNKMMQKQQGNQIMAFAPGENNTSVVLFSSTPQTVTVGDDSIAFYDDGGIDGKVSEEFNGIITFVPKDAGKKILIDFSKVKIFEGSLYSQFIKVYNGTTADEANLIQLVKKGTTPTIKSTSADGALTVRFESTTKLTDDGFEAVVRQFVPQAMTTESIETIQFTKGTVCAGDADQPILSLNIKTKETEPALKTEKFVFNTNGTHAQVSKAVLYFSKTSKDFSTTTKVGETMVTADEFEIIPVSPISLTEGENYFWLAYTIGDDAMNGQKIDASVVSITLNGNVQSVENGNPDGDRTVNNIVYSQANIGTVTKVVNGSMIFKTQTQSQYSTKYQPGTDDRINTFIPKHEGMLCQIDFSKFDLTYASSSYGVKAKFKVYSGQGTNGELLWELTSANDKKIGPGRVLRSKAVDGALTVVFCPNDNNSYNTAEGFVATVSEYLSKPMSVDTVMVSQTSDDIVTPGAKSQAIVGFNVKTEGEQNVMKMNQVVFDLKGSQKSIEKVYVYSLGAKDAEQDANATPVGTAVVDVNNRNLTVTLTEALPLLEGNNFFRVCFDLKENAGVGEEIDVAVQSLKIGENDIQVSQGDPEGTRVVRNVFFIQKGNNNEILIAEDAPLNFYDDGGPTGKQAKNFNGTVTFAPKEEGNAIKLIFKEWKVSGNDKMYIYYGGELKDKEDAVFGMYGEKPNVFVSKSDDGKLTIKYTTKSYQAEGFAIEVVSYKKLPLSVSSVTTSSLAPQAILKGETDVKMVRVDVDVKGDYIPIVLKKFVMDATTNTIISQTKVYATDTIGTFATTHLFGKTSSGSEIEGEYIINEAGTYKFWIAYDIKTNAVEGNSVTASLASVVVGGESIHVSVPVIATTTVKKGMSGTYSVGPGTTYPTIQSAIDAISSGVEGPVILNVKKGIYNEKVIVPHIPGTSENNTITLQSETGNYADVRIYDNSYTTSGYSDDQMAKEYGVFTFNGADWFTLKGIEITTTDKSYPSVVHVKNESRHVTIDDCYLHAAMTTNVQQDINIIGHYAVNEANRNNDYLMIKNNLIEGGYIGVNMGGTNYVRLPKEVGGIIEHNTFRNQGSKSIYVMDELGAKVRYNVIENTATEKNGFQGIDAQLRDVHHESFVIEGNSIRLATNLASTAIDLRQMLGTEAAPVIISNNEIIVSGKNFSYAGLKISSGEHVKVAHNTILMKGTAGPNLWFSSVMGGSVNVVNNILQNEGKGYVYNTNKTDNFQKVAFSNNVVYTNGDFFAFGSSSDKYATFDDWKTASGESDSYNKQAVFLHEEILEPSNDLDGDLLKASVLAYVTKDINETVRATQPTIGAYEYNALNEAPKMHDGFMLVKNITDSTACVVLKADMNCKAFVLVKKKGEAAPMAEDIMTSGKVVLLHKNKEGEVCVDGLVTDSTYVAYAVLKSLREVVSLVNESKPFIASGTPIVEVPTPKVVAEDGTTTLGNAVMLTATVTDGTAPFKLKWYNGKNTEISTTVLEAAGVINVEYTPSECDDYVVVVSDANGKATADTCRIIVTGDAVTATFENLYLQQDSYWNGFSGKSSFVSGSYKFDNGNIPEYKFWYDFGYSNQTSTSFSGLADQFHSAVGCGFSGSENYVVAYPQGGYITVLNKEEGDSIRGFYISNNAYAVNSITKGDGFSKAFVKGDWFKVTITGFDAANNAIGSVDYYLADYRSDLEADHYYLDTWQWVDLRSLGTVKKLRFKMSGSDSGEHGLNTPAYFCLDNFNGNRVIKDAPLQTTNGVLDIKQFFTFDNAQATVTYAIADPIPTELATNVQLSADGSLKIDGAECRFEVVISAMQKGKIEYVRVPIDFVTSMGCELTEEGLRLSERYSIDGKRVSDSHRGVVILRMEDGTTRKVTVK